MNKQILYLIWVLGLAVSAIISYMLKEPIPFMLWVIIILASIWAVQVKDLSKRVKDYEAKQP